MPDREYKHIQSLIRANRILCAVVIALTAVLFLGGASFDPSDPSVLRAQKFELVDAAGKIRAELAIDKESSAGLFVRDTPNRVRASVTHDDQQSALYLRDAEGGIRLGAAQFTHGGGGYARHGPKSKGAAVLYYKNKGSLTFYDNDGTVKHRMP